MGSFSERIGRSWRLMGESWKVLRSNPSLALFPVLSGFFTILASIPFIAAIVLSGPYDLNSHNLHLGPVHYILVGGMYLVNYFIVIFFNSALVASAYQGLNGEHPML